MDSSLTVRTHQLFPRAFEIQSSTPFLQSQCTGGYLCGWQFQQQGCYATPDYSTCSYNPSAGASYCTVCICYGFENGENGCDQSSSTTSTSTTTGIRGQTLTNVGAPGQGELFNSASRNRLFHIKSFVVLLSFCLFNNLFGMF